MKENVCIYEMQAEDIMDKMDKDLRVMTPEDVVIIISLQANLIWYRKWQSGMRLQGIPVISVTRHTDNPPCPRWQESSLCGYGVSAGVNL